MEAYKLRVKVGQAEFEAEGPEDVVRDQFDLFMGCLSDSKQLKGVLTQLGDGEERVAEETQGLQSGANLPSEKRDCLTIEKRLKDVFKQASDGVVSLNMLPQTEKRSADALILILYGYLQLNQQDTVPSVEVTQAARQSGVQIQRVSLTIAPHRELVVTGGNRKSARYRLNNRGIAHAEQILEEMFD